MNESLIPRNVYQNFVDQKISKFEAIRLMSSLIEETEDTDLQIEGIQILNKLGKDSYKIFKILENFLISDENEKIRRAAAETIFQNYLESGFDSLMWSILNDTSPLVLRSIRDLVKNNVDNRVIKLKVILNRRINSLASKYKIVPEEVSFLLDLGIQIGKDNIIYLGEDTYYVFEDNEVCIIKNGHITELSISLKSEIPQSIDLLKKLKFMDLSSNFLIELPNSLYKLKELKELDLSWNNFTTFPKILTKLKSMEYLDLSNNQINNIPENFKSLDNLKFFYY